MQNLINVIKKIVNHILNLKVRYKVTIVVVLMLFFYITSDEVTPGSKRFKTCYSASCVKVALEKLGANIESKDIITIKHTGVGGVKIYANRSLARRSGK